MAAWFKSLLANVGSWFKSILANAGVVGEIFRFFWQNKKWWLIPMLVVLLLFGILMVFATATGIGPFIYTLF
jgi:uncharacterized membrane protein